MSYGFPKGIKVPHHKLLHKLQSYGNRRNVLLCLVNGGLSTLIHVLSGIPQGSVLGPLLFIIFMNDLPELVQSSVYLFADDTKYSDVSGHQEREIYILQTDLDSLQNWLSDWLLSFHPEKCKVMSVQTRYQKRNENQDVHYHMSAQAEAEVIVLDRVSQGKDLGILTDNHMEFEDHIAEKVKEANQIMGLIRRCFSHLDMHMFRSVFNSIACPHLEYGQSIWSP